MGDSIEKTSPEIDDGEIPENLCSWCKDLDLNEQKFFISADTASGILPGYPKMSRSISSLKTNREINIDDNQRSCIFCDLLWRTVQRYSPGEISSDTTVDLTWEIDGRKLTNDNIVVRCTRRIRVSWADAEDKKHDAYMVLAAPSSHFESNSGSDSRPSADKDISFLGRVLASSSEILELIREWLLECVSGHWDGCRQMYGNISTFRNLVKQTYFGVVDVVEMRLTELPCKDDIPEPYVALSYVWGTNRTREKSYMTTRYNVMVRIQPGGLKESWDSLPKTIQDTILLVKQLGIRYVWIDSLCIVQDSVQNWQSNAEAMHLVYLHAYFTICAADGDVATGLSAIQRNHTDPKTTPKKIANTDSRRVNSILSAKYPPSVHLLVSKLPESVIQDSDWNKRAWTFQERILSRRCVVFAGDRVYFQCRQMVMSQEIFPSTGSNGWSLDWTNSPLRTLNELTRKAFWFYMKSVRLYTSRELSKSKDILAAFEGVSWLLEQHLNAPLLYGLPASHFDLALLWMPLNILDRRSVKIRERSQRAGDCQSSPESSNDMDGIDLSGKEFPSWSWCGWKNGKIEYTADVIDGCSQNACEWLKHHTWIQWHVRDYKGYLRPLWSRNERLEDSSSDIRWRGYTGLPNPVSFHRNVSSFNSSTVRNDNGEEYQRKRKRLDEVHYEKEFGLHERDETNTQHTFNRGGEDPRESIRFHRQSNTAYIDSLRPKYYANYSKTGPDRFSRYGLHGAEPPESSIAMKDISTDGVDILAAAEIDHTDWGASFSGPWTVTTKASGELDDYGRTIRYDLEKSRNFTSILPDNPFGVIRDVYPSGMGPQAPEMPVLQFFTLSNPFYVKPRDSSKKSTHEPTKLINCEILDKAGDWCGSIKLASSWIADRQDKPLLFIAISDAKSFTMEECPEWNYYIHKEREESEWDLYYVLLLERNVLRALWERVGLGKVFQAAFAGADWTEIKLG